MASHNAISLNTAIGTEKFIIFILLILATVFAANAVATLMRRYLKHNVKSKHYKSIPRIFVYSLYTFALYYGFNVVLQFDVSAFLAALGIIGIVAAFSSQQVLQNTVAGIILAIESPFHIGDVIEYNGRLCKVRDRYLTVTSLRSEDGKIIYVPNRSFIIGKVANFSRGRFARVKFGITMPSDTNLNDAMNIIYNTCLKHPDTLPDLRPRKKHFIDKFISDVPDAEKFTPKILIREIQNEKIVFDVWFWTQNAWEKDLIVSSVLTGIIGKFRDAGIRYG